MEESTDVSCESSLNELFGSRDVNLERLEAVLVGQESGPWAHAAHLCISLLPSNATEVMERVLPGVSASSRFEAPRVPTVLPSGRTRTAKNKRLHATILEHVLQAHAEAGRRMSAQRGEFTKWMLQKMESKPLDGAVVGPPLLLCASHPALSSLIHQLASLSPGSIDYREETSGNHPLHLAASSAIPLSISAVLALRPSDVSVQNKRGASPLHKLASNISAAADRPEDVRECVKALVNASCDATLLDQSGHSALCTAARQGNVCFIRALLECWRGKAGEQSVRELLNGPSAQALKEGAAAGHVAVVKGLLEAGADPCVRDENGDTALHAWCSAGGGLGRAGAGVEAAARAMLEMGSALKRAIGVVNAAGMTPLLAFCAAMPSGTHPHMLSWQTAGGGGGSEAMLHRTDPAEDASGSEQSPPVTPAAALMALGADLHRKDLSGRGCVQLAAEAGNLAVVGELLRLGAPVDAAKVLLAWDRMRQQRFFLSLCASDEFSSTVLVLVERARVEGTASGVWESVKREKSCSGLGALHLLCSIDSSDVLHTMWSGLGPEEVAPLAPSLLLACVRSNAVHSLARVLSYIKERRQRGGAETQGDRAHGEGDGGDAAEARLLAEEEEALASVGEFRDSDGASMLHVMAKAGNGEGVRLLLSMVPGLHVGMSCDESSPFIDDGAPLHFAARTDRVETARVLLACGADVNACNSYHKETALHVAGDVGSARVLELLLDQPGVDVDRRDGRGRSVADAVLDGGSRECSAALAAFRTRRLSSE